jgi:hypothetical protein
MKEEIWVDSATHYEYKRKAEELQAKLDAAETWEAEQVVYREQDTKRILHHSKRAEAAENRSAFCNDRWEAAVRAAEREETRAEEAEAKLDAAERVNCIDAEKGRGYCDHCADGKPDLCRYMNTVGALARLDESAQAKMIVRMAKENNELQAKLGAAERVNFALNEFLIERDATIERVNPLVEKWDAIADQHMDAGNVENAHFISDCANELKQALDGDV